MPGRHDADRWGDLEILEVTALDLPRSDLPTGALWWCGRCGDDHRLATGSVVRMRSHLGVTEQIACGRCAGVARRRAEGPPLPRVLVAEDNGDYRDLIRQALERQPAAEVVGYVADGRAALVELDRLHPDVMVLDLGMPRLDGIELLAELPDDLEVIVLSGQPRLRERCQRVRSDVTILPKDHDALDRLVGLVSTAA